MLDLAVITQRSRTSASPASRPHHPMNSRRSCRRRSGQAAREPMLVKEKEHTRARDALAAERRRMPWMAVEKDYRFEGPDGPASLLDLFEGRRQLIVYRPSTSPGVCGWPERACVGCSMVADQVAHPAHLNARDTTLAYVSRAPQAEIRGLEAAHGLAQIPWYTITDDFDADFGVGEWHGTTPSSATATDLPDLLHQRPRRRGAGEHLELPRHHRARAPGGLGGLTRGLPADPDVPEWWRLHDEYPPLGSKLPGLAPSSPA